MSGFAMYIIPILYVYFAWQFRKKPAPYGDTQGAFTVRRSRESEEIWDYTQKAAGNYCLVLGVALAVAIYAVSQNVEDTSGTVFWIETGVEVASIALMIPVVSFMIDRRFPKK